MYNPFEPERGILGNMIRQGEEVRVREKCGGFVLEIEGVSIAHRPSRACAPLGPYPLGTAENRRVVPSSAGAGSVNLGPSDPISTGPCLCIGKEGDGVGSKATFSGATASICDLFGLVFNNGQAGVRGSSG